MLGNILKAAAMTAIAVGMSACGPQSAQDEIKALDKAEEAYLEAMDTMADPRAELVEHVLIGEESVEVILKSCQTGIIYRFLGLRHSGDVVPEHPRNHIVERCDG